MAKENLENEKDAQAALSESPVEQADKNDAPKPLNALLEAFEWVESLLVAMLCVVLLFTFAGRTVIVDGHSMDPTLSEKDALIVTRLGGKTKPGDIVAVTKLSAIDRPLVKRVIAVGGQTVDIDGATGAVSVDGKLLEEPYIYETIHPDSYYDSAFPQTVPEGMIFLMGDNRNNSWDSRSALGAIDERHVLGKVVLRYLPFDSIGMP